MRGLTQSGAGDMSSHLPKGIAFAIAELVLAKNWAAFHDLRMAIRLDHGTKHEEYEEVLEFRQGAKAAFRGILWRNERAVFIQPLVGRRQRFTSVAAALESLHPMAPVALSNIQAMTWPAR
jgi:hypothetical protein